MDVLKQIQEPLVLVASIIVALTTVIGAYEKWWLKPREARKEKERHAEREEMRKLVENMVEPFKEFSQASEADRKFLNEEVVELKGRMSIVEEKVDDFTTKVIYREEY